MWHLILLADFLHHFIAWLNHFVCNAFDAKPTITTTKNSHTFDSTHRKKKLFCLFDSLVISFQWKTFDYMIIIYGQTSWVVNDFDCIFVVTNVIVFFFVGLVPKIKPHINLTTSFMGAFDFSSLTKLIALYHIWQRDKPIYHLNISTFENEQYQKWIESKWPTVANWPIETQ